MALLVHHWPMDEGSGDTFKDVAGIADLDGTLFVRNGYPQWVTSGPNGEPALRFNGTWDSVVGVNPRDIERAATTEVDVTCNRNQNFTISAWVNLRGSSRPRPIFTFQSDLTDGATIDAEFHDRMPIVMLYLGTDGKLYFGWQEAQLQTMHYAGVASTDIWGGSSSWVHITGRQYALQSNGDYTPDGYFYAANGSSLAYQIYHDIWINGVYNSQRLFPQNRQIAGSLQADRYGFGRASPMAATGSNYYPATKTSYSISDSSGSDGALYGDLRDVRVYCGLVKDVPSIPYPPIPPVVNSIMFSCNT